MILLYNTMHYEGSIIHKYHMHVSKKKVSYA
jgi:hypothetical protein